MSKIHSEYLDIDSFDCSLATDVRLRQEPDEEEDEEDDGEEEDDEDNEEDEGYSELPGHRSAWHYRHVPGC